jgi:membrane-anchored protein YejM (alkaline phosphatase superfamily)
LKVNKLHNKKNIEKKLKFFDFSQNSTFFGNFSSSTNGINYLFCGIFYGWKYVCLVADNVTYDFSG